jgi:hypothetical protein
MRTLLSLAAMIMLVCAAMVMAEEAEKPWFDMQNCAFCKEVSAQPGLMDHMRHEYHNVSAGILTVGYVDKEFQDKFKAAQAGMQKVVADLQAGKQVPMCQHCEKIGYFMMKGVKLEEIHSADAEIFLYTSADPATVKELQEFGARCTSEMAKMSAAKKM